MADYSHPGYRLRLGCQPGMINATMVVLEASGGEVVATWNRTVSLDAVIEAATGHHYAGSLQHSVDVIVPPAQVADLKHTRELVLVIEAAAADLADGRIDLAAYEQRVQAARADWSTADRRDRAEHEEGHHG